MNRSFSISNKPSACDTEVEVELRSLLFSEKEVILNSKGTHTICGTITPRQAIFWSNSDSVNKRIVELIGFTQDELNDKEVVEYYESLKSEL